MTSTAKFILFILLALSMTSCSWVVNLVIANNSGKDIFVRYIMPSDSENNQFYKNPKTYRYDESLLKLHKSEGKRPEDIPTDIKIISETNDLEVRLAPGQAVHVGRYYSSQSRLGIISQYNLKVLINKDSILTSTMVNDAFKHWKNIRTDLLEVR